MYAQKDYCVNCMLFHKSDYVKLIFKERGSREDNFRKEGAGIFDLR